MHRLNRAEYANAIRDLLALDVDVSSLLPPDDSSAGFDNNADVLGVSPVLLESYLTRRRAHQRAGARRSQPPPAGELYRVRQDESQDRHIDGLPLGTVGGLLIDTTLPLDGEYQFQVRLFRTNLGTMRGLEYPHQLEISVDGERVHLASFGGDKEIAASSDNPTTTGDAVDGRFTVRVPLKAGPHTIGVAFLEKTHALNTRRLQNYVRSSSDTIDFSGYPHIDEVILDRVRSIRPGRATRRAVVASSSAVRQGRADEDGMCAADPLDVGAPRLSRPTRRTDLADADGVLPRRARRTAAASTRHRPGAATACWPARSSSSASSAIRRRWRAGRGLSRVRSRAGVAAVVLPLEQHPGRRTARSGGAGDGCQRRRCSSAGAADARRSEVAGARRQLRRPVAAAAQPEEQAAELARVPGLRRQPARRRCRRETELFFASIMREDRSVLDLMTADYTFVNERLARHYGIPNVYGSHFRRVTLRTMTRRVCSARAPS